VVVSLSWLSSVMAVQAEASSAMVLPAMVLPALKVASRAVTASLLIAGPAASVGVDGADGVVAVQSVGPHGEGEVGAEVPVGFGVRAGAGMW